MNPRNPSGAAARPRPVAGFGLGLALVAGLLTTPLAQAFTFKIATLSPEGSSWMETMRDGAARIERETAGRVKFRFYPGGVMGDDRAMLRKMRINQIHGAALTGGALTSVDSDVQLYSLPLLFRNFQEVDYVRERMDDDLRATLEAEGYVIFGIAEAGFAYAMTQEPATTVAEMREFKVWAPEGDPGSVAALDAFDIQPVPLTLADVLAGLQTGLIDAIAAPPIGALALQWYTQVDYVLDLPLLYVYGMLTVTERAFERISEEDRQIVRRIMAETFAEIEAANRRDHRRAFEALLAQDIERLEPSPEATARWNGLADTAIDAMIDADVVSRDRVEYVRALLEEFRAQQGAGAGR